MTRVFRSWTPAEFDAVVEIARQHPKKDGSAIARLAADHLGRTFSSVHSQVGSNTVLRRRIAEARAEMLAEAPAAPAPEAGAVYTRTLSTPSGDASWSCRLAPLPFDIEGGPRDESRPYDRRAAFGARPVPQPDPPIPSGDQRAEWFKGLLAEVGREVRA